MVPFEFLLIFLFLFLLVLAEDLASQDGQCLDVVNF